MHFVIAPILFIYYRYERIRFEKKFILAGWQTHKESKNQKLF